MKLKLFFVNYLLLAALLVLSSCASLNKMAKATTERLDKPPFYRTFQKFKISDTARVYRPPIDISDRFKFDPFYKSRKGYMDPILNAMNRYVDSLQWTWSIDSPRLPLEGAPQMYVGSSEGEYAPSGSEAMRNETDSYPPLILYIEKPSREWRESLSHSLREEGGNYLLMLKISFDEFPKANKRIFGKKVVLGTDYEQDISFLSAVDKPVEVMQIMGILLDIEGNILRAGTEGIIARDTPFALQLIDIEKGINQKGIDRLLNEERREDLPGQPLKWQVALHNLMVHILEK